MHDYQKLLLGLAREAFEAASAEGIPLVAADRFAWQAYWFGEFRGAAFELVLAAPASERARLRAALSRIAGRELDSFRLGSCEVLRFLDAGTFYLDLLDRRRLKVPAVGIDIRLLPFKDGVCPYPLEAADFSVREAALPYEALFPAEARSFEGLPVPLPRDCEAFFALTQGKAWRTSSYAGMVRKKHFECIYDLDLPYALASRQKGMRRFLSMRKFQSRRAYDRMIEGQNELFPLIDKGLAARDMVVRRYYHWETLLPQKERILGLGLSEDKDELAAIFEEYLQDLAFFMKKHGLALFVEEWVYKASRGLLAERLGESFAGRYDRLLAEGPRKGVEDLLREHGVRHPLLEAI